MYNSQKFFKKNIIWIIFIIDKYKRIGVGEYNSIILNNKKFIINSYKIKHEINNLLKLNNRNITYNFYINNISNPSILFALEQAFLFLKKGKFPILYKSEFTKGIKGLPINDLLWLNIWKENKKKILYNKIKKKIFYGFKSIKIKISKNDIDYQSFIIKKIGYKYPKLQIRLDANGCFNNINEYLFFINKIKIIKSIYYLEQPILPGKWKNMAEICKISPIPIALDEEIIGINNLKKKRKILDFIKPKFLIIRPSANGGFYESEEWISEACKRGIKWGVSSSLESNIGINIISQWTFIMNNKYKKYNSYFHGLNTKNIYKNNISITNISINSKNGFLWYKKNNK
ncbi:enolase C-terminal domain-like protein [Blattabacterium cuenoti]|uniref:enolase C-terminal domain-like protein n=1 Tax=Blattabacterium cuenoti TaxID=1653831 RepID=UPI001EEB5CE5|nr:enolase C-terminal domain-like protein [Blattabacterium cuenoti]